ncbi:MAG TPA: DNA polymerase III subunit delta [Steroidobacteraceae bacterium]|nr:DNA polymerase III subunit delta [Steroidobacteraceae bacterium]
MKLTSETLERDLSRQLLSVYLISGDEPLLAGEAADAIRARARAAGFTEREVHFMERGADWDVVRGSVSAMSLFASRRIVEVRLPSGKPGVSGGRTLVDSIESLGNDTLLLILTGRLDREAQGAEWVRAVQARGGWLTVWPVAPERMRGWIETRARGLKLTLEPAAVELLTERTQGNLLAALQELEKLKLLLGETRVSAAAVLASSADSARFDVAQLSDALLAGDAARGLRVLGGLRAEGAELPLVVWAVTRAMRGLWAQAGQSRRAARLPYGRLVARAVRADGMAKGRLAGDAWDELQLLAADLCGVPAVT